MQSKTAGMPAAVPRLLSVATAVPKYKLSQNAISDIAARMFVTAPGSSSGLARIYSNAATRTRYSCVPLEWYERPCHFSERNRLYVENEVNWLAEAARKAVERARLTFGDIDGLVVVSSSGIATPSLDALLMERLGLKRNMERLPVFGLGCGGGVSGLARTAQLARGAPCKRYLFMVVELCGLDFIHADRSKSNAIATALFADGAGAAVISCDRDGPALVAWHEHTWPGSLDVMGWDVTDQGLRVVFSRNIPAIVRNGMRKVVDDFLESQEIGIEEVAEFLCHPGAAKVLDSIESALDLPRGHLRHSRGVLCNCGNMSATTMHK